MSIIQSNLFDEEIWKPVDGYEGLYEVSNLGRVKSIRYVARFKRHKELILVQSKDNNKTTCYLFVGLHRNGKCETKRVHQLVAGAFLPQPPTPTGKSRSSSIINHLDSNPLNNRADNLEWTTYLGNVHWSYKTNGQSPVRNVRLTDDQVIEMRRLKAEGMTITALGKMFKCSVGHTHNVVNGKSFKHLL